MKTKQPITLLQLLTLCILLLFAHKPAIAQVNGDTSALKKLIAKTDLYNKLMPVEKIFVHLDKPYYAVGDTAWFKIYVSNAATNQLSLLNGKVYFELIGDSSKVVERLAIPLNGGIGMGDIKLNAENIKDGNYTIRAYTNWMQNFGEDHYYHQQIYIAGALNNNDWLVGEQHTNTTMQKGINTKLALKLTSLQQKPITGKEVDVLVLNGSKTVYKYPAITSPEGIIAMDFTLSDKIDRNQLDILVKDRDNTGQMLKFPLPDNTDDIDIQFLPEGGYILGGVYNRVAFKAIDNNGLGVDVTGTIVNSKGEQVNTFTSTHKGMGSFALIPQINESYTAKIKLASGSIKDVPLPLPKPEGIALRVDNLKSTDSVYVFVSAQGSAGLPVNNYNLIIHSNSKTYYALPVKFRNNYMFARLPKKGLLTGITNFSVVNSKNQVLNQRKIFINSSDSIKLDINTNQKLYAPLDSIAIQIQVNGSDDTPLLSNISIAVTDDEKIKHDQYSNNMVSQMLLTSELKGNIEEPGWYFEHYNAKALDCLMLTQGWTCNYIEDALTKTNIAPKFEADSANNISGKLKGFMDRAGKNLKITLFASGRDIYLMDTISNDRGEFVFKNLPFSDSVAYTFRAHTQKGKSSIAEIIVNEFKPAAIPASTIMPRPMPWFARDDASLISYLTANFAEKQRVQKNDLGNIKGRVLNTVEIKGRKPVGVKGIYGEDLYSYDANITEKDLIKGGRVTLFDYLKQNVKGFNVMLSGGGDQFMMNGTIIKNILVDGRSVDMFSPAGGGSNSSFNNRKLYMQVSITELKQIVMTHYFDDADKRVRANLLIKSRSGSGPILPSDYGKAYVYRPIPVYLARDFYKPRYKASNNVNVIDYRSTIHWEPNIITDDKGKANFSFFAAAKPATYTLIIEGTTLDGRYAHKVEKITISDQQKSK
ncbi:hypothetical protein IM792_15000 [Mucilaginibacter sp. JRF]|uniref:hypothetical protein n=1 Tax=Mucilaginibacter sp. JRF TaxID=2780088 RepID=UPI001880160B|nr:hypothetical protein [Mucilaginibacter sp. JRF]MBE9585762.1 hypothetical protein [Mucilaginibacter sp. JRF]